jgi:hypothetical protein
MSTTVKINGTERANLICKKDDRFILSLTVTNTDGTIFDLSQFPAAQMDIKAKGSDPSALVSFTLAGDLSTGYIQFDVSTGCILLDKLTLDLPSAAYVYDLELTNQIGAKSTILEGILRVSQDVTQ